MPSAPPASLTLRQRWYPFFSVLPFNFRRILGLFPVIIVLSIIAIIYVTTVPLVLIRLISIHPHVSYPLLIIFHYVFLSTLSNYIFLVVCDPGSVPSYWQSPQPTKEVSYDGTPRYCRQCLVFKPDRSHHCSVCNRCILRMDHHCIFINNCVGYHNHKFFLSFVIHAFLGCLLSSLICLPTFSTLITLTPSEKSSSYSTAATLSHTQQTIVLIGYIVATAFTFALLIFVVLHMWLALKNRTTIEMYELVDPTRSSAASFYDLGAKQNWLSVCGPVPLCWVFPTRAYCPGDGLQYPNNHTYERLPQYNTTTALTV